MPWSWSSIEETAEGRAAPTEKNEEEEEKEDDDDDVDVDVDEGVDMTLPLGKTLPDVREEEEEADVGVVESWD